MARALSGPPHAGGSIQAPELHDRGAGPLRNTSPKRPAFTQAAHPGRRVHACTCARRLTPNTQHCRKCSQLLERRWKRCSAGRERTRATRRAGGSPRPLHGCTVNALPRVSASSVTSSTRPRRHLRSKPAQCLAQPWPTYRPWWVWAQRDVLRCASTGSVAAVAVVNDSAFMVNRDRNSPIDAGLMQRRVNTLDSRRDRIRHRHALPPCTNAVQLFSLGCVIVAGL